MNIEYKVKIPIKVIKPVRKVVNIELIKIKPKSIERTTQTIQALKTEESPKKGIIKKSLVSKEDIPRIKFVDLEPSIKKADSKWKEKEEAILDFEDKETESKRDEKEEEKPFVPRYDRRTRKSKTEKLVHKPIDAPRYDRKKRKIEEEKRKSEPKKLPEKIFKNENLFLSKKVVNIELSGKEKEEGFTPRYIRKDRKSKTGITKREDIDKKLRDKSNKNKLIPNNEVSIELIGREISPSKKYEKETSKTPIKEKPKSESPIKGIIKKTPKKEIIKSKDDERIIKFTDQESPSKKDLPEIDKPRYDRRNRRSVTTKYEAKPIEVFDIEVPTFKKLRIMKKEINFMLVPSGESELLFDKPRYDSKDRRRGKSEQPKESDKGKKEDDVSKDYKDKVKEDKEIKDIPKDKRGKVKPEDKEEKINPKEKKEKFKPKDKKEEIELKEKEVSEKIKDILEKVKPETNVIDIQIISKRILKTKRSKIW